MLAFACVVAWVIDGDTFICRGGRHVRLAGIDAPELHGCPRWRQCTAGDPRPSLRHLIRIAKGRSARCERVGRSYDRVLAFLFDRQARPCLRPAHRRLCGPPLLLRPGGLPTWLRRRYCTRSADFIA